MVQHFQTGQNLKMLVSQSQMATVQSRMLLEIVQSLSMAAQSRLMLMAVRSRSLVTIRIQMLFETDRTTPLEQRNLVY